MRREALDELLRDLRRRRILLLVVEILRDANDDVRDQRVLRPGVGERHVFRARGVHVVLLLVALAELVLRVGSKRMVGVVLDDALVVADGLVVLLQLLRELTEQVVRARLVLLARVVIAEFLE